MVDIVVLAFIGLVLFIVHRKRRSQRRHLIHKIDQEISELQTAIKLYYLVQPCSRCHEFLMQLIDLSPNGRSVHYHCVHCGKKMRAPAGTPDVHKALNHLSSLIDLAIRYNKITKSSPISPPVQFETPPAPLPYEQNYQDDDTRGGQKRSMATGWRHLRELRFEGELAV